MYNIALMEGKSLTEPVISVGIILVVLVAVCLLNLRAAQNLRRRADLIEDDSGNSDE